MKYISLDEEDFNCLVRGGIITVDKDLKICLKDIGFHCMAFAIEKASKGIDIRKDHKRTNHE